MLPAAFSPDRPVVAAVGFDHSRGRFEAGDPFPSGDRHALGVLWRAGLVRNAAPANPPAVDPSPHPVTPDVVAPTEAPKPRRARG